MPNSSVDRNPLDVLAEEFVERFRSGQRPSLTEYAERRPDLADEIRDLFPALVEMEQLKPGAGEHTGDFAPIAEPSDPDRVGEFRIVRRVGHGGMGVVYEAVQESLGRHVALKLLPAEAVADPKRLERFRREAKSAARLHHTNIVPVFGVGEADRRHYYAMQFIDGHPLDAVVDEVRRLKDKSLPAVPRAISEVAAAMVTGTFHANKESADTPVVLSNGSSHTALDLSHSSAFSGGSLSDSGNHYWNTVARIGAQVADALAYAHGQGILHRDIKPANLLLDLRGTVWVTDFGLAKAMDADDLTHAGDVVGTLRYMAPERFDGPGDSRSDTYALGLTLYELLTLKPAFLAENRAKLVQEVTAASPMKPRKVNPAIPRDLETIVLKAIARDPAMRYQTATEMHEDLNRYLEDRPIRARRASKTEQAWRWCRRNPAVASLLAAVLLILVSGATISTAFAIEAEAQEREARKSAGEAIDAADRADKEKKDAEEARRLANISAGVASAESKKLKEEQERQAGLLYISQINHAQTAASELRTFFARKALAQTDPQLRGWEWNYLDRQMHLWDSEVVLDAREYLNFGFGFGRGSSSFTPFTQDGSRFIAQRTRGSPINRASTLVLFDTATGKAVIQPLDNTLAVSPEGGFAVTGRTVTVTGEAEVDDIFGYYSPPSSTRINRVRVVEIETGIDVPFVMPEFRSVARVWLSPEANRITVAAWRLRTNPNGQTVSTDPYLVVSRQGSLWPRFLELRSGPDNTALAPLHVTNDGHVAIVNYGLDNNGRVIPNNSNSFVAIRNQIYEFWNLDASPPVLIGSHRIVDTTGHIEALSAGGTRYAVLDGDNSVVIYDPRTALRVGEWTVPPALRAARDLAGMTFNRLAVSDDGRRVVLLAGEQTFFVGDQTELVNAESNVSARWRSFVLRGPDDGSNLDLSRGFGSSQGQSVQSMWLAGNGSRLIAHEANDRLRTWNLDANPEYARTWAPSRTLDDGSRLFAYPDNQGLRVVYANPQMFGFSGLAEQRPASRKMLIYDVVRGKETRRFDVGAQLSAPPLLSDDGLRLLETTVTSRVPVPAGIKKSVNNLDTGFALRALDGSSESPLWSVTKEGSISGPPFTRLLYPARLAEKAPYVIETMTRSVTNATGGFGGGPGGGNAPYPIQSGFTLVGAYAYFLSTTNGGFTTGSFATQTGFTRISTYMMRPTTAGYGTGNGISRVSLSAMSYSRGPTGRTFSVVSGFQLIRADTGAPGARLEFDAKVRPAPSVIFHPDGTRAVIATVELARPQPEAQEQPYCTIRCVNPDTGKEFWTWTAPEPSLPPGTISFSPFNDNTPLGRVQLPAFSYSPDGRQIAVLVSGDAKTGRVRLLNSQTGALERDLKHELGLLPAIVFGPSGRLMVGSGREALVWDREHDQPILRLDGHEQQVAGGVFSADGRRLFTLDSFAVGFLSGSQTIIRVWDMPSGQMLLALRVPSSVSRRLMAQTLWLEGDRLHLLTDDGVRVFDGSPRTEDTPIIGPPQAPGSPKSPDVPFSRSNYAVDPERILYYPDRTKAQYEELLASADQGRVGEPTSQLAWREYGGALMRLKRYDEALKALDRSAELVDSNASVPSLRAFLALTHHHLGHADKAKENLARLRRDLNSPLYSGRPYLKDILREAEGLIGKLPSDADPFPTPGGQLPFFKPPMYQPGLPRELYESVLKTAENRLTSLPDSFTGLRDAGGALYRLKRYEEAKKSLIKAVDARGGARTRPAVNGFLAMTYYQLGDQEMAKATLETLRQAMMEDTYSQVEYLRDLLAEAEALIEAKKK